MARGWKRGVVGTLVGGVAVFAVTTVHVVVGAWGRVIPAEEAPAGRAVIVFGARAHPYGPSGFLAARLDLAVALHEAGKASTIVVSGDARAASHNEPRIMREYLEQRGVPSTTIVEDPGGYDTYDTCYRTRYTYGIEQATLVTQDYHLPRALTICRGLGIDAVGVGDEEARKRWPLVWAKNVVREPLANLKMEWDLLTRRIPSASRS